MSIERARYEALDRADSLAPLRELFLLPHGAWQRPEFQVRGGVT